MKALVIVMLLAAPASAERWDQIADRIQGGGYLHDELSGGTRIDDAMAISRADQLVLAGVRMGGFIGAGATIGYHLALDLFAGSTLGARGFAYDVAFYPLGIAARFGKTSVIAFGTGIGGSGAVGTLEDGAIVPVQATLELGKGIRVLGRARVTYVLGAGSRQSAAPSIPFGDEFDAMLGIRLGRLPVGQRLLPRGQLPRTTGVAFRRCDDRLLARCRDAPAIRRRGAPRAVISWW